ncbi:MAG: 3-dehydroquinate synthase [Clostridia bacterium]|nr:3-dehydroquinate synthase [Clostridia bacterium]
MYTLGFRFDKNTEYHALIGEDLAAFCNGLSSLVRGRKALILTDETISDLHLAKLTALFDGEGINYRVHLIPVGESAKNFDTFRDILTVLSSERFVRGDHLIAFGGGSVGDIGGFAASVYMRGMSHINIPTTLLSMIDSSVGGKTGIDMFGVKNAVGTFHQPKLVLCATEFLSTLPKRELTSGFGEVIKYIALSGKDLCSLIGADGVSPQLIYECLKIKREYVLADEFDSGRRQILNLGHTFGHAFEAASEYALSHGEAVALGLIAEARFGAESGLIGHDVERELAALSDRFCLCQGPIEYAKKAAALIARDKKSNGESISMPFVKRFGAPFIADVSVDAAERFILSNEDA